MWTITETKQQLRFVVSRNSTHSAATRFIATFLDVRREHAEHFRDFRAQCPTKRIDDGRSDRAERASAHRFIRPPVPRAIRDAAIVRPENVIAMTHRSDRACLQHPAHPATAVQKS